MFVFGGYIFSCIMITSSLVCIVFDVRRNMYTRPLGVIGSQCSVIVCLPGHFCFYFGILEIVYLPNQTRFASQR